MIRINFANNCAPREPRLVKRYVILNKEGACYDKQGTPLYSEGEDGKLHPVGFNRNNTQILVFNTFVEAKTRAAQLCLKRDKIEIREYKVVEEKPKFDGGPIGNYAPYRGKPEMYARRGITCSKASILLGRRKIQHSDRMLRDQAYAICRKHGVLAPTDAQLERAYIGWNKRAA